MVGNSDDEANFLPKLLVTNRAGEGTIRAGYGSKKF